MSRYRTFGIVFLIALACLSASIFAGILHRHPFAVVSFLLGVVFTLALAGLAIWMLHPAKAPEDKTPKE